MEFLRLNHSVLPYEVFGVVVGGVAAVAAVAILMFAVSSIWRQLKRRSDQRLATNTNYE